MEDILLKVHPSRTHRQDSKTSKEHSFCSLYTLQPYETSSPPPRNYFYSNLMLGHSFCLLKVIPLSTQSVLQSLWPHTFSTFVTLWLLSSQMTWPPPYLKTLPLMKSLRICCCCWSVGALAREALLKVVFFWGGC